MDAEVLRAEKEGSSQGRIRRSSHRVDNRGQLLLLEMGGRRESSREEVGQGLEEERCYVDPDPEGILIGNEGLRSYLEKRGEKRTIALRRLLRGLELKGLHKKPPVSGRRPYHPAGMVGLILLGLLEGKSSLRQLETLARTDLRACWVSGGIQPDHSVIGRFIQEHGEELSEGFFEELTRQVLRQSRSWGGDLAGDGTVIQAAGSSYRKVQTEAAEQAAREAEEASRRDPQNARLKRRKQAARRVAEVARERLEERQRQYQRGEVGVSPGDPEAVIQPLKAPGGTAPSYKPVVLSNREQIIVAQKVDPSCEHAVYAELVEQARRSSGEVQRVRLDGAYFNFEVLTTSAREQIEVLCPEGKTTDAGGQPKQTRHYHKSLFVYDEQQDCYRCPAQQRLVAIGPGRNRGQTFMRYGRAPCQDCEQRDRCTTSAKGRTLKRYDQEQLKDQLRAKMKQPQAQQEYRKRKTMVEPVFARIKQHQGLRRFRRRGVANVRVEFALWAAAHNLGRWWALQPDGGPFSALLKPIWALLIRSLRPLAPIRRPFPHFSPDPFGRLACHYFGS